MNHRCSYCGDQENEAVHFYLYTYSGIDISYLVRAACQYHVNRFTFLGDWCVISEDEFLIRSIIDDQL